MFGRKQQQSNPVIDWDTVCNRAARDRVRRRLGEKPGAQQLGSASQAPSSPEKATSGSAENQASRESDKGTPDDSVSES